MRRKCHEDQSDLGNHEYSPQAHISIPLTKREGVAWFAIGCRKPIEIVKPSLRLRATTSNMSGVELSKHDWSQLRLNVGVEQVGLTFTGQSHFITSF